MTRRPRRAGTLRDLVDDVLVELRSRPARALLMAVAVGLSCGALISSVGISVAASSQIDADLAASTLDVVTVSAVPVAVAAATGGGTSAGAGVVGAGIFPADAGDRARAVDLVEGAGMRLELTGVTQTTVTRTQGETYRPGDFGAAGARVRVVGLDAGYLAAARVDVPADRSWHLDTGARVAFLGPRAAEVLGVPDVPNPVGVQVWVDGDAYDVLGIVRGGVAGLDDAVVVPYGRAVEQAGRDDRSTLLVRTVPGAGASVSHVIATAVRPDAPERLAASPVVGVDTLRRGVTTQLDRLAAWTGSVLLALTVLLIANSMVVAVTARAGEIGLRRALGFSRAAVAAVFLAEGGLVGLLGGLVGSAVASATVVATAAASGWSAVLDPWLVATGPALGATVGLAASVYPALRAARVSPALALRSD